MIKVRSYRRMLHSLARSHLRRGRPGAMSSTLLAIVYVLTPLPWLANANPTNPQPDALAVKCSSTPVTAAEQCHLDLNDRMKIDLGTWGSGVHPRGPNYFCVQRQKLLQRAPSRGCR
jgi:hypothetical protein